MQRLLLRYTQALFSQVAQAAACNRMHPIEERCARWLLMTHDRVGANHFMLTQDFLAQMLGVRRPSVSVAASMLQKAGLISYSRGLVVIADRPGLEAASCICYRVIRDEFERLIRPAAAGL
jgi:CRP-like cAMP-binding protein